MIASCTELNIDFLAQIQSVAKVIQLKISSHTCAKFIAFDNITLKIFEILVYLFNFVKFFVLLNIFLDEFYVFLSIDFEIMEF